jgi:hypothetical protein
MVSSLLTNTGAVSSTGPSASVPAQQPDRKPAYRTLMLDSQGTVYFFIFFLIGVFLLEHTYVLFIGGFKITGREIDEYGNVVKSNVVKTIVANVAVEKAMKMKKENPYLAHRLQDSGGATAGIATNGAALPSTTLLGNAADMSSVSASAAASVAASVAVAVDERLPHLRRDLRAKKALHFVEPGRFIEEAEKIKRKEERKIIAGYASGRKNLQQQSQQQQEVCAPSVFFRRLIYFILFWFCTLFHFRLVPAEKAKKVQRARKGKGKEQKWVAMCTVPLLPPPQCRLPRRRWRWRWCLRTLMPRCPASSGGTRPSCRGSAGRPAASARPRTCRWKRTRVCWP